MHAMYVEKTRYMFLHVSPCFPCDASRRRMRPAAARYLIELDHVTRPRMARPPRAPAPAQVVDAGRQISALSHEGPHGRFNFHSRTMINLLGRLDPAITSLYQNRTEETPVRGGRIKRIQEYYLLHQTYFVTLDGSCYRCWLAASEKIYPLKLQLRSCVLRTGALSCL